MKIAVCTTFPYDYWNLCAGEMVASFDQFWPKDVDLFIQLDNLPKAQFETLHNAISTTIKSDRQFFIGNTFEQDQIDFLAKHQDHATDYRFQVKRFSYKVFALAQAANHAVQEGYDYLIWLDADVVTKKAIDLNQLIHWLPDPTGQVVSYLGRKDAPHSECGFVAYNLKLSGHSFIGKMKAMYVSGDILKLPGWTDCDAFDNLNKICEEQNAAFNLTAGIPGWHVWPLSPLGQFMEHRKGNRKVAAKEPKLYISKPVTLKEMEIKTKNCVEHDVIKAQIKENCGQIRKWVSLCAPNDEEIVICSAGESLSRDDIMPFYERGVKIVAVKHAIERLKEWGIKPWACVLLDPRPHVEQFVHAPDKDVIYFVSSMIHPSVVKTLNAHKCKVIGYHAYVNAGESEVMIPNDYMVCGGSATATRSIGLLHECLGFSNFHLFGYDLCHFAKPDPAEKHEDGTAKYAEVTLSEPTWGNKPVRRTFWTEGQFLAQAKELADLYKSDKGLKIQVYGDGIGGWSFKHWKLNCQWAEKFRDGLSKNKKVSVNEWIDA